MEPANTSPDEPGTERQPGYLDLVRSNKNFRRLWAGNVISLLGDWFNFIALIAVVERLTGSPLAIGIIFLTKMLPGALASPIAGYIADRFSRRRLMIICDVLRAAIVLALLLIDEPSEVYLVYVLATLQVVVSSVFHPAQSASIPNVTTRRELLTANALMSISWSVMLAFGAALGGFATDLLGPQRVFILDSVTYLVSAYFISRTVIPDNLPDSGSSGFWKQSFGEVYAGWQYLRDNTLSGKIATAKAAWALGGGGLVYMLALAGQEIRPDSPDIGVGILFAARGLGTGIGPLLARRWIIDRSRWPRLLGIFVILSGMSYFLFGALPWAVAVGAFIVFAHAASGAGWVLSSVLLQENVEDRFRGRVFATEMLLVLIAETISTLIASVALQLNYLDLSTAVMVFAASQIACGAVWTLWIKR